MTVVLISFLAFFGAIFVCLLIWIILCSKFGFNVSNKLMIGSKSSDRTCRNGSNPDITLYVPPEHNATVVYEPMLLQLDRQQEQTQSMIKSNPPQPSQLSGVDVRGSRYYSQQKQGQQQEQQQQQQKLVVKEGGSQPDYLFGVSLTSAPSVAESNLQQVLGDKGEPQPDNMFVSKVMSSSTASDNMCPDEAVTMEETTNSGRK